MPGFVGEWVDIVVPVLSLGFAVASWAFSHGSRKARAKAEAAEAAAALAAVNATRQREAVEKTAKAVSAQLAAVERIAESLAGPPLIVEQVKGVLFRLRNNRSEPVKVSEVANWGDFAKITLGKSVDLDAWQTVEFQALGAWQLPRPTELVMVLSDQRRLRVPFPAGA